MRNKFSFILIVVLSFGLSNASAQLTAPILKDKTNGDAPELFSVGNVKGTVKSTAIYIAKPVYPPEAQQAGVEGAVRVQITIDEEGNVISAKAIEGHSLLRTVGEDAAQHTKFRIARDSNGNAVKVEGILTYNFTIQKAGWTRIGYGLSLIGQLPASYFSIPTAAKAFAPEWTDERQMLEKLSEIGRNQSPPSPPIFVSQSPITKSSTGTSNETRQSSAVVRSRLSVPPPPTAEQIALAQTLVAALQSRLGNDELGLWQFNLGLDLSRAFQLFRNPDERANAAQTVRRFAKNAPGGASAELAAALKNMAANFEKKKRTMESDDETRRLLIIILKSR